MLLSRPTINQILEAGAISDDIQSTPSLLQSYISSLDLKSMTVSPALMYDKRDSLGAGFLCPKESLPLNVRIHQEYSEMCEGATLKHDVQSVLNDIRGRNEFTATLFGNQSWNSLTLEELESPTAYFDDIGDDETNFQLPYTLLSWGYRLERGRTMMIELGIDSDPKREVSYESLEKAFNNREFLTKYLFRNAKAIPGEANFFTIFSGKRKGYILSTLNQFTIFHMLKNDEIPPEVMVLEDDIRPVRGFKKKVASIMKQLEGRSWDVSDSCLCVEKHSWWDF